MCLATPGLILSISGSAADAGPDAELWRQAEVDFGGVRQVVSLACLPGCFQPRRLAAAAAGHRHGLP